MKNKTENFRKRKTDSFWYKIKDQIPMFGVVLLVGIIGYFLNSFFENVSKNFEKNALAHEELYDRTKNAEFFVNEFKEFKIDLGKRLDRIERKLDR